MADADFRALLARALLDAETFVRAAFSGRQRGAALDWERLTVRPVMVRGRQHLQFSYYDAQRHITRNHTGADAAAQVQAALELPFRNFHVVTSEQEIQVNLSKKGRPVVSVRPAAAPAAPDLAHDRTKQRILAEGAPLPYLQALGVMTAEGRVRAAQRAKFAQINEFLRLLAESGALTGWDHSPVEMVDFGCGSAALTFALYHYMNEVIGVPARMTGVDLKADLIARHQQTAAGLAWDGLRFVETAIADYAPPAAPDVVIALHACDTATDDAIAQGIRAASRLIVCAPCCHHNLQAQLALRPAPAPFGPVLRYGLFHERLGDVLTDTFRTLVLRAAGYQVDVVEFVAPEHTPRNVMLRAVRSGAPGDPAAAREYVDLAEFWRVRPYLERALGDDLPF